MIRSLQPPDDYSDPLLISDLKVAELLNVSRRTVWRLLATGGLPQPVRIMGCVRWRYEEIKNWVQQLR